jgi:site-specific DNA recombinase
MIVDSYQDRAVSGASLIRPGIQALLGDALRGRFEVVVAEALDRISRDQEMSLASSSAWRLPT